MGSNLNEKMPELVAWLREQAAKTRAELARLMDLRMFTPVGFEEHAAKLDAAAAMLERACTNCHGCGNCVTNTTNAARMTLRAAQDARINAWAESTTLKVEPMQTLRTTHCCKCAEQRLGKACPGGVKTYCVDHFGPVYIPKKALPDTAFACMAMFEQELPNQPGLWWMWCPEILDWAIVTVVMHSFPIIVGVCQEGQEGHASSSPATRGHYVGPLVPPAKP